MDMIMNKMTRCKRLWALFLISLLCTGVFTFSGVSGLRLNLSASLPLGFYKLVPAEEIHKSDLIIFSGAWPVNKKLVHGGELLKRVQGTVGDIIDVSGDMVTINGDPLAKSQIFDVDGAGEKLPRPYYPYTLQHDEYYAGSDNIYGYDSRYFGPVEKKHIKGRAFLIWKF